MQTFFYFYSEVAEKERNELFLRYRTKKEIKEEKRETKVVREEKERKEAVRR